MRLFGAVDCSEDLGLDLVNYLVRSDGAKQFDARLLDEYSNRSRYCAVHMASASLDFGIPVFKAALATRDPRLFDIDLYGTAAYGLATRRKTDHWAWMFQNIPAFPGHGRVAESIVFDLAANFGDMSTVSDIKVAVERKPELAVSASFALSRIGGREAQETIENWLRDPELSKREEKIASGWVQGTERFSNLFKQALDRMKARTPASRSPRN